MKVTIIHGQSHKGSTYHIAYNLAEKLCQNTYQSYDRNNMDSVHDTLSTENSTLSFFFPEILTTIVSAAHSALCNQRRNVPIMKS